MLKRRIQDLTVCFTYNFSCLQPQNRSQKDFRQQYYLHEEIHRGGFGIVYKAYRVRDNLPVAVKYVEHKHVCEWTMYENQLIPTEICYLELCANVPGVVCLIDWFASSRGFMIVMERPEKCSDLFDVITAYGRLDEDVARWIFIQILDTVLDMKQLHSLVHRDIKDENVIVNMETGEVKLVDFGAADFIDSAQRKHFQGTRSYCPPEWFKQRHYLPLESTSWSLGILLYTMIVGRPPFRNEIQTCMGCVHFPVDVSPECQQLIRKCLCVTPKRRLTLNEIRAHVWTQNEPSLKYAGAFSALLRKRSFRQMNGRRRSRRRQNSVAWNLSSEYESEDEPALRRSFLLATSSSDSQALASVQQVGAQRQRDLTSNLLNTNIYDLLPSISDTSDHAASKNADADGVYSSDIQCKSAKRNPLLRQFAEHRLSLEQRLKHDSSFDTFQSVTSQFSGSQYELIREKTFDTALSDDAASMDRSMSSAMYYSACESLPEDDLNVNAEELHPQHHPPTPVFLYEDSLRSLMLFDNDDTANNLTEQIVTDRTRTPSAESTTEICVTPSPSPSLKNAVNLQVQPPVQDERKGHKSMASTLNKRLASGVRRAKSLKLTLHDKYTNHETLLTKKRSTAAISNDTTSQCQSLPLKVVHHLAANSYDTLITLSAKMAEKMNIEARPERPNTEEAAVMSKRQSFDLRSKDARTTKMLRNLSDIVVERRTQLLQNAQVIDDSTMTLAKCKCSKSRESVSAKHSLQYETVRFPLAVFDVCQQQLPFLEQVTK